MIDRLMVLTSFLCGFFALFCFLDADIYNNYKTAKPGIILAVIAAVCLVTEIYVSTKLENQPWTRPDPYVIHTVMALQDGNEINGKVRGSRYSISGYINEEFMYVYGYKTVGGGMKIQKVSEKNATVYFDDNVTPNAKWYRETKKFWWSEAERYTCDIFIPTDSLQAELVIDLQ